MFTPKIFNDTKLIWKLNTLWYRYMGTIMKNSQEWMLCLSQNEQMLNKYYLIISQLKLLRIRRKKKPQWLTFQYQQKCMWSQILFPHQNQRICLFQHCAQSSQLPLHQSGCELEVCGRRWIPSPGDRGNLWLPYTNSWWSGILCCCKKVSTS